MVTVTATCSRVLMPESSRSAVVTGKGKAGFAEAGGRDGAVLKRTHALVPASSQLPPCVCASAARSRTQGSHIPHREALPTKPRCAQQPGPAPCSVRSLLVCPSGATHAPPWLTQGKVSWLAPSRARHVVLALLDMDQRCKRHPVVAVLCPQLCPLSPACLSSAGTRQDGKDAEKGVRSRR